MADCGLTHSQTNIYILTHTRTTRKGQISMCLKTQDSLEMKPNTPKSSLHVNIAYFKREHSLKSSKNKPQTERQVVQVRFKGLNRARPSDVTRAFFQGKGRRDKKRPCGELTSFQLGGVTGALHSEHSMVHRIEDQTRKQQNRSSLSLG